MRYLFLILLLAIADLFPGDGEKEGRRGNELYQKEEFGPAAEAYRAGIAALGESAAERLRYGLHNNLGAALLKSGDAAGARKAFSQALADSRDPADFARTSYNAGNAAYSAQELEKALAHYRQSLLRDPGNQDAKFNYEFVKRRLKQQQQQQQQQRDNQQQDEQEQQQNSQGQQEQQNQDQSQQQQDPQDGGEQQQQGQQPEEQQQQQAQPQESQKLSKEQAERILQALQNEEEQLLRQVQRKDARPRKVEKDW